MRRIAVWAVFGMSLAAVFAANPVAAATCNLRQQLRDDRRPLEALVPVAKRDRAFLQGFGLTLQTQHFGGARVDRGALFAALERSNCDPALRRWIKRKARAPRRQDS